MPRGSGVALTVFELTATEQTFLIYMPGCLFQLLMILWRLKSGMWLIKVRSLLSFIYYGRYIVFGLDLRVLGNRQLVCLSHWVPNGEQNISWPVATAFLECPHWKCMLSLSSFCLLFLQSDGIWACKGRNVVHEVGCGKSYMFGALFSAQLGDQQFSQQCSSPFKYCRQVQKTGRWVEAGQRSSGGEAHSDLLSCKASNPSFAPGAASYFLYAVSHPGNQPGLFWDLSLSTPGRIRDGLGCGIPGCI